MKEANLRRLLTVLIPITRHSGKGKAMETAKRSIVAVAGGEKDAEKEEQEWHKGLLGQ